MTQLEKNQTYRLGHNIIRILEIDGDRVTLLINGVTTSDHWSTKEIENNINEGHLQLL